MESFNLLDQWTSLDRSLIGNSVQATAVILDAHGIQESICHVLWAQSLAVEKPTDPLLLFTDESHHLWIF